MMELLQANWPILLVALLIGIAIAYLLFVAMRRTSVDADRTDVLDEGAAPAARNQALIDAEPAATPMAAQPDTPPVPTAVTPPAPVAAPLGGAIAPVMAAATEPAVAADDLTRIKGVGPKLRDMLATHDVTRLDQIAAWTDADIARIDPQLGRFQGRIERDNWVEQAKLLTAGDDAAYEGKFGKQ